ncbi:MAG TPA: SMC-Scp complex subunit ScpB [Dehalococcoidia bacterium]
MQNLVPPPPEQLPVIIESLLFVAEEPLEVSVLARTLGVERRLVERALAALGESCRGRGIRLQRDGSRVQLVTCPEAGRWVERFLGGEAEARLSTAALETLAIVAYRQPVTRAVIESIRGVNSERAVATLRSRGLIEEVGRADTVGRPVLWGTTARFLEWFGLESLDQLPPLPEPAESEGRPAGDAAIQGALL